MPIQQKLPPPVLLFSDFAGWVENARLHEDNTECNVKDMISKIRGKKLNEQNQD